jgi:predicted phosphodiesterase
MTMRAPRENLFNVQTCEAKIPIDASSVSVLIKPAQGPDTSLELPLPNYKDGNVAIIGDTGCHNTSEGVLDYFSTQNCSSQSSWPFETIAKSVASTEPTLVVHLGDYVYRSISKSFDRWEVWEEDFFKPAKGLFTKAPLLFVRGNHEQCKESPRGWFHFLAPGPYTGEECPKNPVPKTPIYPGQIEAPYTVEWGALKMLMLDSSVASDVKAAPEVVKVFKEQLAALNQQALSANWTDAWLLTHRVTWGCAPSAAISCSASGETLRAAWKAWKPEREAAKTPLAIQKFMAGHIHMFSVADFADQDPLQLIVGNSGASLNGATFWNINDGTRTVKHNYTSNQFGFVLLSNISDPLLDFTTWRLDLLDVNAKVQQQFFVSGKQAIKQ